MTCQMEIQYAQTGINQLFYTATLRLTNMTFEQEIHSAVSCFSYCLSWDDQEEGTTSDENPFQVSQFRDKTR
jgi:hypothetical protein